jgi:hypothetical protein
VPHDLIFVRRQPCLEEDREQLASPEASCVISSFLPDHFQVISAAAASAFVLWSVPGASSVGA